MQRGVEENCQELEKFKGKGSAPSNFTAVFFILLSVYQSLELLKTRSWMFFINWRVCSAQSYHAESSQDQTSYTTIGVSCFLSIIFCKLDFIQMNGKKPISGEIIQ